MEPWRMVESSELTLSMNKLPDWFQKRNVETWILCLNVHVVDEETDYKANGGKTGTT